MIAPAIVATDEMINRKYVKLSVLSKQTQSQKGKAKPTNYTAEEK